MLEEKTIIINEDISKKDKNKVFVIRQIPATRLKKLLFSYQSIFNILNGNITIDSSKKEELYFDIIEEIECKTKVEGKTVINKLTKNTVDAFIEDIKTMDYLVKEFWNLNVGESTNLIQESLENLTGIC